MKTLIRKTRSDKFPLTHHSSGKYFKKIAATIAARSGGPFVVERLMGHVNLTTANRYDQDISAQTDILIEDRRQL